MSAKTYHVLFLSRRNSARSIIAEAVLSKIGSGRFDAHSAAVQPAETIDPRVIDLLRAHEIPVADLKPKHYEEFARDGADDLDFVFTLSDTAAGEPLPEWPGRPVTAHWSCPDPFDADGPEWEQKQALARILAGLERRLEIFVNLPLASLDRISLNTKLTELGQSEDAAPS